MNTFLKRTEIDLNECEHFLNVNWDIRTKVTKCIREKMIVGVLINHIRQDTKSARLIAVGKRSFRLEITLTAWNLSKTPRRRVAGKNSTHAPKTNSIIPRNPRIWSLKLSIKHNKENDFHALRPIHTIRFSYTIVTRMWSIVRGAILVLIRWWMLQSVVYTLVSLFHTSKWQP